jgi:hypothetical protein
LTTRSGFAISWKRRARRCPTWRVGAALISMMTSCCALPSRSSSRIVGEAAKHVSHDLRTCHPEVSWLAAARMRDRLVHHYFDINLDVLWSTVTHDLPRLLAILPDSLAQPAACVRDERGGGEGAGVSG